MKCSKIYDSNEKFLIFLLSFLCCIANHLCVVFYNENDSKILLLQSNQTEPIYIISSNRNVEFSLVSVHTQLHNVTLSYDDPTKQRIIKRSRKIDGSNVGLVVLFNNTDYPKRSHLYLRNRNNLKQRVFIKVLQYDGFVPVPGGCNLEFPVAISPFLQLKTYDRNWILEFQKASLGSNFRIIKEKQDCDFSNTKFVYDVYSYYLKENDYSEQEYVQALRRMSDVESIEAYGTKLENQGNQPKTRIRILAYRGKGVVFNVIVSFLNYKAAYSPIISYDCDITDNNSCKSYSNWLEVVYRIANGLAGLILCLDATKNARFEIAYLSYLFGSSIVYVIVVKFAQFSQIHLSFVVLCSGLLTCSLLSFLWHKYPNTSMTLILSGIHFEFLLISSIVSFNIFSIFRAKHSITFGILIVITLLILPICSSFISKKKLHAFCCAIFGSYLIVIAIEQFFNGSLIYIAKNAINTVIYTDFYEMQFNLPFLAIDYFFSAVWIFLTCISLFLNVITDTEISLLRYARDIVKPLFSYETYQHLFKTLFEEGKLKKYEEIETVDDKDEDISKYNELTRSIIGSFHNLDKENEICNTSFNGNSKNSSPLIKRRVAGCSSAVNTSSTKIDFPPTPTTDSRCETPRCSSTPTRLRCSTPKLNNSQRSDHASYLNQSIDTPNKLLKSVVIQNARYSTANKSRY